MAVRIVPYSSEDRAELERLITELQGYIAEIDPEKQTRPKEEFNAKRYVALLLEKVKEGRGYVLLAADGEKRIGCIAGIVRAQPSEQDFIEGYPVKIGDILELVVEEKHRGKKVGELLVAELEQIFQKAGCQIIHVSCFAPNIPAHRFYLQQGYFDRNIDLWKNVFDQ
ncbi:MAG: GNAT family N-acetyltransferase [Candidatus Peribacteraceae bacterium]|nr:GNAT family N-acetyltransferase [Candidatus Peribacteraceae bacterium]MDD5742533.1 GNAT family N-acetyltransferase [Candidatus Peribacteraceae bacterium]